MYDQIDSLITITLIEPEIPPNTGNIARLCAANNFQLHLVGKLGFELTDKRLKRAGMDYWQYTKWTHFPDVDAYIKNLKPNSFYFLSSKVNKPIYEVTFKPGDTIIYGSESTGLDKSILDAYPENAITIPMISGNEAIRCLNLANSAAIVAYEAVRQLKGF